MEMLTPEGLAAFLQVIAIDLALAGDNAVVIGLAAAGLPAERRRTAIIAGIAGATVLRIGFAAVAIQLLAVTGILLAGGLLLLWVCWKIWCEIRSDHSERNAASEALADADLDGDGIIAGGAQAKTLGQAALQIIVADVSMSLDNVLAVAGAAREHPVIMAFGLILSITMIGVAASMIARLLDRYRWIAYVGLLIILYVALDMVHRGSAEIMPIASDAISAISG